MFPRPQLTIYSLLVVSVVYTASKMAQTATSVNFAAAVACMVMLPLPVVAYWVYILLFSRFAWLTSKHSTAALYRADSSDNVAHPTRPDHARTEGTHPAPKATLALLGAPEENPTLVIRSIMPGEEEFDAYTKDGSSSDDDSPQPLPAFRTGGAFAGIAQRPLRPANASKPSYNPGRPLGEAGGENDDNLFYLSLSQDGISTTQGAVPGSTSASSSDIFTRKQTWIDDRAGSSISRLQASTSFLNRFGFLVDDLVGCGDTLQLSRVRIFVLGVYLFSFVQRCLTAVTFGAFHMATVSTIQLALLLTLHAAFILYLLVVRPYTSLLLSIADVLAYSCELAILVAATILLQRPGSAQLENMLVACYYVAIALIIIPEGLQVILMGWQWAKGCYAHRCNGSAQHSDPDGQITANSLSAEEAAVNAAAIGALRLSSKVD